jgi:hypothetical protein
MFHPLKALHAKRFPRSHSSSALDRAAAPHGHRAGRRRRARRSRSIAGAGLVGLCAGRGSSSTPPSYCRSSSSCARRRSCATDWADMCEEPEADAATPADLTLQVRVWHPEY